MWFLGDTVDVFVSVCVCVGVWSITAMESQQLHSSFNQLRPLLQGL